MREAGTSRLGVTARYADGKAAGRAVERLSLRGVDGGRIHVVGADAHPQLDRVTQRVTDAGTATRLRDRLLQGAAVGAPVGLVFGAVVVALASDLGLVAVVAGALGGASASAGLGALAGLLSTPTMSEAWEDTFGPERRGGTTIAVACRDAAAQEAVERVLAGTGAIEVRRTHDLLAVELGEDVVHSPDGTV